VFSNSSVLSNIELKCSCEICLLSNNFQNSFICRLGLYWCCSDFFYYAVFKLVKHTVQNSQFKYLLFSVMFM
jgi:hypothetical protein